MLRNTKTGFSRNLFASGLLVLTATFVLIISGVSTVVRAQSVRPAGEDVQKSDPVFRGYKGVQIGMSMDEVHRKLGEPKEPGTTQDYYAVSEKEVVQVFYDASQKVMAVSVNYLGEGSGAPQCKEVLGTDITAGADGAIHKLVQYPKAGYWVSYNRSAGDDPLVTVTMQKIKQ
jgi:hypothetical protein